VARVSDARLDLIDQHLDRMDTRLERMERQVQELLISWREQQAIEREREPARLALLELPHRVDALEAGGEEGAKPAIVQVMGHPRFLYLLATAVLVAMAVAGSVTFADLRPYVPHVTVGQLPAPALGPEPTP
jgi:hypothetical protein